MTSTEYPGVDLSSGSEAEKCTSSGTLPDEKPVSHVYHVLQQPRDVKPWGLPYVRVISRVTVFERITLITRRSEVRILPPLLSKRPWDTPKGVLLRA
jgi:hypothetical protein